MTSLDSAYEKFIEIKIEAEGNSQEIVTEEDSKIQIINRVLTECLGWSFSDIGAERKHENGFSDYLLKLSGQNALILEAKRVGRVPVNTSELGVLKHLKLNGPGLTKAYEGISQAASYAQPNGVPVAVLTDGEVWIVFKPVIAGESYLDKQAFVFPSLTAIVAKFAIFYDLLSKETFSRKVYNQAFDELHNTRVLLTSPLEAPIEEHQIYREKKSKLAFDLEPVFDNFFSRMTGEDDPDMIIDCFVETRESRIADHSLEKMTTRVLGNISSPNGNLEQDLSDYLNSAVELDSGESIFIVGPTGAGKSTFIDRFFKKTLESETRAKCVPIRLNFLEVSGSLEPTLKWITETLIERIETALFLGGIASWNELRGLYYSDYDRQRRGVGAKLYARDKTQFQEEFGKYMAKKVEEDREGYLKRLLSDIVHNRQKLPIIIADNTDEFSPVLKEAIFQYLQSLRIHSQHCLLIFPITDKSAWSFTKTDIYAIYQSKSFFLPTPPPREVFRRRIDYLREKLIPSEDNKDGKKYLTDRNIKISIGDLGNFANAIEDAFVNDDYAAKTLGELSNYNIRRTLRLARRVITSPIFQIEDLILAFASGKPLFHRRTKFLQALIKGDYNYHNKNDNDAGEIVNIFQVDRKFRQSPLLQLRILALLDATYRGASNVEDKHLTMSSISEYFQAIGSSEAAVDSAVIKLIETNLIEPFDPSIRDLSLAQRLAINFAGQAHLRLATSNPIFFEQMALTTAVSNTDIASMIRAASSASVPFNEKFATVRSIFSQHLLDVDELELTVPNIGTAYDTQRELLDQIKGFITAEDHLREREVDDAPEVVDEKHIGVLGIVDFYDVTKGFGFVDIQELGERCYVGRDALRNSKLDAINDGDDILCDIGPSPRGPQVILIHDIQNRPNEIALLECVIVRLVPAKLYGFVSVSGLAEDALFHFSLMKPEDVVNVKVGMRFQAEVRTNSKNGLQQVRRIEAVLDTL